MDIIDYTGIWSCTSRSTTPPPTPGGSVGGFRPDWDAWNAEMRRRKELLDRFIAADDEEILVTHQ